MGFTISSELGMGYPGHNSRDYYAEHIDKERTKYNIEFVKEDIRDVYHILFDDAVEEHNRNVKRREFRIDSYYDKIRLSKHRHPYYECIFQIGNMHDIEKDPTLNETFRDVLIEYFKDFIDRNPNIYVFSAHLHMDETTPHIHIDFVPYTTTPCRYGLSKRVSLNGAFNDMGFIGEGRNDSASRKWLMNERRVLSEVMERNGLEYTYLGTHDRHLPIIEYKIKVKEKQIAELDAKIDEAIKKSEDLSREISDKMAEFEYLCDKNEAILDFEKGMEKYEKIKSVDAFTVFPEPKLFTTAKAYRDEVVIPIYKEYADCLKAVWKKYTEQRLETNKLKEKLLEQKETVREIKADNERLRSERNKAEYKYNDILADKRRIFNDSLPYQVLVANYGKENTDKFIKITEKQLEYEKAKLQRKRPERSFER